MFPKGWQLLAWVGVSLFYLSIFSGSIPWPEIIIRSQINVGLLALVFYLCFYLLCRYENPLGQPGFWVGASLLVGVAALLRAWVNTRLTGTAEAPFSGVRGPVSWLAAALIGNLGMAILSYLVFVTQRRGRAERDRANQEKLRREAELQQLRSHINPHFLFNVLNNIYSLASVGSEQTAATVLQLSNLLRYVTYQSRKESVELQEEIEKLHEYIALFQLRSPSPFDVSLGVKGKLVGCRIEPMLLIPLLENAFKHGDFILNPTAFAHFELSVKGDRLYFYGENSYDPKERQKDELGGIGLDNLRQRIAIAYGPSASLRAEENPERGVFRVELAIPITLSN